MSRIIRAGIALLSDPARFSALVLHQPLRPYQLEPLAAIVHSVTHHLGHEFLLIFPRQAGKNETVAHLLVYLLNLYQRTGGNIVYGAIGDQLGLGIERLEARLDNPWNLGRWTRAARPTRRILGSAAVIFVSSHPQASARGQTAHHLLVIDETQDQDGSHIESVFTPMRASTNATALYIGTVRTSTDFLWTKKLELERDQAADGHRRVYLVSPESVIDQVPAYRHFLQAQIQKHGRNHPIIASEYFLEPIDAAGGLFPPRRRQLMLGTHPRLSAPVQDEIYVATIDLAGEDEATTDPVAALARPGRDYTVATLFRIVWPPAQKPGFSEKPGFSSPPNLPTWEAVDVFVDHGSKHFEDHPGRPALAARLLAWLTSWRVAHVLADESGVGAGLVSWLTAALGPARVTGYNLAGPGKKAALGAMFLSLIETGRFHYWADDHEAYPGGTEAYPGGTEGAPGGTEGPPGDHAANRQSSIVNRQSDAWWFWRQVEACSYELPPAGRFEHDLKWQVPAAHKTRTPTGPQPTHDDRLLSAALVAELDRSLRAGELPLGRAVSAVIPGADPLRELSF